jgi:hypothetical protein
MAHAPTTKTLPPTLVLLAGVTAGVFATFVVEVELAAMHMPVAGAWAQLTSGAPLRFASASVLWAIAGVAFVVGAATAAVLGKYPPPWRSFRTLRWILGAALIGALAYAAHDAGPPHDVSPGAAVLADLSAFVIATVMALLGAAFARPR